MDEKHISMYLKRAQEIIGERSLEEIEYDNAVVANLEEGLNIKKAIETANNLHPKEALDPDMHSWDDVASRYQYLKQHKAILVKLNHKS